MKYMVDVTTADVTAATYLDRARLDIGYAASRCEAIKIKKYQPRIASRAISLIPAAIEMPGRWGDGLVFLIQKACALAKLNSRDNSGLFGAVWKRRIAIVHRTAMVQQAQQSLMKTAKPDPEMESEFMDTFPDVDDL
jgi:hypothetical protein